MTDHSSCLVQNDLIETLHAWAGLPRRGKRGVILESRKDLVCRGSHLHVSCSGLMSSSLPKLTCGLLERRVLSVEVKVRLLHVTLVV